MDHKKCNAIFVGRKDITIANVQSRQTCSFLTSTLLFIVFARSISGAGIRALKEPTVNMVTAKVAGVHQVTTPSKGKAAEWEAQEAVRKTTQQWVEKVNQQNAEEVIRDL